MSRTTAGSGLVTVLMAALVAGLLASLLAGWGDGDPAAGSDPSGPAVGGLGLSGSVGSGSSGSGSGASPGSSSGDCPVGSYTVAEIVAKDVASTALGRLHITGGASIRVAFAADGTWTLSDDGSQPVTVSADGHRADGRLSGSLRGTYAAKGTENGTEYEFAQTGADGEIRVTSSLGDATLPLAAVGPALAPTGSVTLTCSDTGLTVDSDNVSLELTVG